MIEGNKDLRISVTCQPVIICPPAIHIHTCCSLTSIHTLLTCYVQIMGNNLKIKPTQFYVNRLELKLKRSMI